MTTSNNDEKRVLLLGLDNAGKTSVLLQFKEQTFTASNVPTVGLNIEQIEFKNVTWIFWDVGGQATRLWKHYFDTVSALMFVIDCTDKQRLMKSHDALHKVARDEKLKCLPIMVLINKVDMEDKRMT